MKKFSNLSKTTEEKIYNKLQNNKNNSDDLDYLRYEIINLMDDILSLSNFGSIDNRYMSGSIKIAGKELLADAIIDLFDDEIYKSKCKVLESLKLSVRDWSSIDDTTSKITKKYNDIPLNSRYRFKSILEKYKNESLELFFESSVHKFSRNTISDFISILNSKHLSNNINDDTKNRILYILTEKYN